MARPKRPLSTCPLRSRDTRPRRRRESLTQDVATVEYVAPAPIVVAARLSTPREVRRGGDHFVVGATWRLRVGFAPAHVKNVLARIGIGLTAGAVCARDIRRVRKIIRHPSTHVSAPPASRMLREVSRFPGICTSLIAGSVDTTSAQSSSSVDSTL